MEAGPFILRVSNPTKDGYTSLAIIELISWNEVDREFTLFFVNLFCLEFGIVFDLRRD